MEPRHPAGQGPEQAPESALASSRWSSRRGALWRVVLVRGVAVVAVLGLVAVLLYLRPHTASSTAIDALAGSPGATVTESSTRIRLEPTVKASTTGVVFYPGALVDPRAYVPNLLPLAEAGYPVVILKLPYNIAFFDPNGAAGGDGRRTPRSSAGSWAATPSAG